jgi:hypothetical protein
MHIRTICLFSGCAISTTLHQDKREPLWGRKIESDGTEYFRIGDLLIKTRGAHSR